MRRHSLIRGPGEIRLVCGARYPSGTAQTVFILGASRSGTTLLQLMLNGNGALFVPPEAWFMGHLAHKLPPKKPLDMDLLAKAKQIISSDPSWASWQVDATKLGATLGACTGLALASVIDRVFRDSFDLAPDVRWGEKSPRHCFVVQEINEVFPDCRFIHIIRDGRDAVASIVERGWWDGDVRRASDHWNGCVQGARHAELFGEHRYLQIYFEQLLHEPQSVLHHICRFFGVEFQPGMLAYSPRLETTFKSPPAHHNRLVEGIDLSVIGHYKDLLSCWDEAIFWCYGQKNMALFYPHQKLSLRLLVMLPAAKCWVFVRSIYDILLSKISLGKESAAWS